MCSQKPTSVSALYQMYPGHAFLNSFISVSILCLRLRLFLPIGLFLPRHCAQNCLCLYNIVWHGDIITGMTGWPHAKSPDWETTLSRLSAIDFSMYLQDLLSLSAFWGHISSVNISQFNMRLLAVLMCRYLRMNGALLPCFFNVNDYMLSQKS